MKHTVHVTVIMSVEIDEDEIKREFGSATKARIKQEAINRATLKDGFDTKAVIFESHEEPKKKVKRAFGSY